MPVAIKKSYLFILLGAALSLTACNEVELNSRWRTDPITIDGIITDWNGDAPYFDQDSKIRISILNDKKNLYIHLLTRSETTKRVFLQAGFTLWINSSGDTDKDFGVQFPLPRQRPDFGTVADHKPQTGIRKILAARQYNLAIVDGTGSRRTMPITRAEETGIYVRIGIKQGYLIYELRMPIPGPAENRVLGIGFETGKLESPSRGRGRERGRGNEGGRGGGGGMKGGGGGQYSGGRPEAVAIWTKVHLAEKELTTGNTL